MFNHIIYHLLPVLFVFLPPHLEPWFPSLLAEPADLNPHTSPSASDGQQCRCWRCTRAVPREAKQWETKERSGRRKRSMKPGGPYGGKY